MSSTFLQACHSCHEALEIPKKHHGKLVKCPHCSSNVVANDPDHVAPPPPAPPYVEHAFVTWVSVVGWLTMIMGLVLGIGMLVIGEYIEAVFGVALVVTGLMEISASGFLAKVDRAADRVLRG